MGVVLLLGVFYTPFLLLALWLIPKFTDRKNIRKIIFIVWFLIPSWDVILGYPIYKILCWTSSGVHIYKTVDNVEGFYVGEKEKRFEPIEPYKGYRYVDYKEMINNKPTGKYYRSYWLDNNTSKLCVPYGEYKFSDYANAYRSGKCIAKEEIPESEVSRWDTSWDSKTEKMENYHSIKIYGLGISVNKVKQVKDRNTNKVLSEQFSIDWNEGWLVTLLSYIIGPNMGINCGSDYSNVFKLEHKTLKPKKGN